MTTHNRVELQHAELTESVIGAFYLVYNELRYGFLEQIYCEALARVLWKLGHTVERQVHVPVHFQGEVIGLQRLDMLVDGKLVLEIKSTQDLPAASHRQLLSYLRGTGLDVGLLLHFGPEAKFFRTVCSTRRGSVGSGGSAGSAGPPA